MKSRRSRAELPRARLVAVAMIAMGLVASSCGNGSSPKGSTGGTLVAVVSGGTYERGLNVANFIPFEQATGIKVQIVETGEDPVAQVQAQEAAGNVKYDVVGCNISQALQFPNLWAPIDYSVVTAANDVVDKAGNGSIYVMHDMEAFPVLGYNTNSYKTAGPSSWADYFDTTKFPGSRGMPNFGLQSAWAMPAVALLADGVSPDSLVPFDLNRAYKKLQALKSHIKVFYTSYSTGQDLLRSGEMSMGILTDGRILQLILQGGPAGVVWNQAFVSHGDMCTPKGAPNQKNAMLFYQWVLSQPQPQEVFTAITAYGPPTAAGVALAQQAGIKDFTSLHVTQLIPESTPLLNYIQQNSDMLLNRWNTYVNS